MDILGKLQVQESLLSRQTPAALVALQQVRRRLHWASVIDVFWGCLTTGLTLAVFSLLPVLSGVGAGHWHQIIVFAFLAGGLLGLFRLRYVTINHGLAYAGRYVDTELSLKGVGLTLSGISDSSSMYVDDFLKQAQEDISRIADLKIRFLPGHAKIIALPLIFLSIELSLLLFVDLGYHEKSANLSAPKTGILQIVPISSELSKTENKQVIGLKDQPQFGINSIRSVTEEDVLRAVSKGDALASAAGEGKGRLKIKSDRKSGSEKIRVDFAASGNNIDYSLVSSALQIREIPPQYREAVKKFYQLRDQQQANKIQQPVRK